MSKFGRGPVRCVRGACLTICFVAGIHPLSSTAATRVGIYGSDAGPVVSRVSGLGYLTTHWQNATQVSSASLANVDVLFVFTERASELASRAATIAEWVAQGNGLIVEQPNRSGPVAIMPPGLSVDVWSAAYDGPLETGPLHHLVITPTGALHPILAGLTTDDLSANADRVLKSGVSPLFEILAVQASNPDYVALAATGYGAGRVVFHTGNSHPSAVDPGSDLYVERLIDWAAIPEPATVLLAGSIGIAMLFRRSPCRPPIRVKMLRSID